MSETALRGVGIAHVKSEYVLPRAVQPELLDDDAAERETNPASKLNGLEGNEDDRLDTDGQNGLATKRPKLSGAARKQAKRQENRKAHRGQNKDRKFGNIRDQVTLCTAAARGRKCMRNECQYLHSVKDYLASKPDDIIFPAAPSRSQQGCLYELEEDKRQEYLANSYVTEAPFIKRKVDGAARYHCPVSAAQRASSSSKGSICQVGWSCRFLSAHISDVGEGNGIEGTQWKLDGRSQEEATLNDTPEAHQNAPDELNWPDYTLQKDLRNRKYQFYRTKAVLKRLDKERRLEISEYGANAQASHRGPIHIDEEQAKQDSIPSSISISAEGEDFDAMLNENAKERAKEAAYSASLIDNARLKPSEKRRLDWFHDELYLAPLTTTGNLPFRRLCTSLGADITCGEMGLAESYLQGQKNEWSLVRRWEGERCFGTQLCGNKPELLVPAAEVLARQFPSTLNFIDVNCGCPIDLVYKKGAGSALLDHPSKLGRIIRGMSAVTGDIPITIKLRTGTSSHANTTHKFFPRIKTDWNAYAVTLHGRSRQQRYKNRADWNYIKQCTETLRESIRVNNEERPDEDWVHPIPIYGNGDVNSWQDYERNKELTGVDGQMLARGALIKPWLFTEIKERRNWDISSRERLDLIRQLTSYGLTHWGSDTMGVNTTRRFVCESISFTHRYIPVGILETIPVQLNERPPPFKGRDDLETLLASSNAKDWVKITEMFLGKAPEEFNFIPKHKSNSYDDAGEDQG